MSDEDDEDARAGARDTLVAYGPSLMNFRAEADAVRGASR